MSIWINRCPCSTSFLTNKVLCYMLWILKSYRTSNRICYWIQVQLLTTRKANTRETSAGRNGSLLYSGGQQFGEKVDSCPRTNSEDSARPWQFLKGTGGKNLSESSREEVGFCVIFHCMQTGWLLMIFLQMLSFFFFFNFIYLFMSVLGLRFCARAFSSCGKRGPLFIVVHGPLTIAASLVAEHRLQTRRLSNCGSRA